MSLRDDPDWPAYYNVPRKSDVPLFIFADHASRYIPPELNNLGLCEAELTRHIAWDIGTESLTQSLCAHYGAPAHIAAVSRLVLDVNRDLTHAGLIPAQSDGTKVPANQALTSSKRAQRVRLHQNYHERLHRALDQNMMYDPLVISLHSFTPKPRLGPEREIEIALLCKYDFTSAEQMQSMLRPHFKTAINAPYSAYVLNYTVDRHLAERGVRHLTFEIRQDLLGSPREIANMSGYIIRALDNMLSLKTTQLKLS